jgi:quercetin dioxygenase-like cupin family protein
MSAAPSNESAVAVRILAELPVPAQATTSRVVINNDVLRVVLFAMDTGQELTDHASPRAVTVQILEGEVQFSVGDVAHDLSGGDVVYLAPNERHALLAQSPCRFSLVMVDLKQ